MWNNFIAFLWRYSSSFIMMFYFLSGLAILSSNYLMNVWGSLIPSNLRSRREVKDLGFSTQALNREISVLDIFIDLLKFI